MYYSKPCTLLILVMVLPVFHCSYSILYAIVYVVLHLDPDILLSLVLIYTEQAIINTHTVHTSIKYKLFATEQHSVLQWLRSIPMKKHKKI